jgi:hypothetical protein
MTERVECAEQDFDGRRASYEAFLTGSGLRFGFAGELARRALSVTTGVQNDTPPPALWDKILPTVRVLEMVRERFGPTIVNSAYRSVAYNRAVRGVGDSRHTQNDAIDFQCHTGTPSDWAAFLLDLRSRAVFRGGVGQYTTFCHVDTRGSIATWGIR